MSESELLETKGRISQHLKLYLTVLVIVAICEMIGIIKIPAGPGTVILLPMLFAVIIGLLIPPQVLGKSIQGLKKIVFNDVVELAGPLVMLSLLPLGVKYGTLVGPAVEKIVKAGPAFLLQELGNKQAFPILLGITAMRRDADGLPGGIFFSNT